MYFTKILTECVILLWQTRALEGSYVNPKCHFFHIGMEYAPVASRKNDV
jgi:hypothetical protein